MNTKLTIKNFRVFDEDGVTVDLKPITVLTGCNSSGKSSVVKAALMLNDVLGQLKDNYNNKKSNEIKLDFTSYPNSLLGGYDNVLHFGSQSQKITFEYSHYSNMISKDVTIKFVFTKLENDKLNSAFLDSLSISDGYNILYSTTRNDEMKIDIQCMRINCFDFIIGQKIYKEMEYPADGVATTPLCKAYIENVKKELIDISENRFQDIYNYCYDLSHPHYSVIYDKFELSQYGDFEQIRTCKNYYHLPILDDLSSIEKNNLIPFWETNVLSKLSAQDREDSLWVLSEFISSSFENFEDFLLKKSFNFDLVPTFLFKSQNLKCRQIYNAVTKWNAILHPEYSDANHTMADVLLYFAENFVKECVNPSWNGSMSYIISTRAYIKRRYSLEDENDFTKLLKSYLDSVRKKSEFAVFNNINLYDASFIDRWINIFGIGYALKLITDEDDSSVQIRLFKTKDDRKGRLLADEGYGITHLVSILMQIQMSLINVFMSNQNVNIFIEEPELHLHPKYQSRLADMFVEASTFGIHFIIETHSEYLIRRLQLLVAGVDTEQKLDKNKVSISYIYSKEEAEKENQPLVKNISICEDGYLDDAFGSGFFDEATNLSRKLM